MSRTEALATPARWPAPRPEVQATASNRAPFIVAFCCLEHGLIVEVDGAQHTETAEQDLARASFLEAAGYHVIRFWNHEVLQHTDSVLARIETALAERRAWPWGHAARR